MESVLKADFGPKGWDWAEVWIRTRRVLMLGHNGYLILYLLLKIVVVPTSMAAVIGQDFAVLSSSFFCIKNFDGFETWSNF
jgi:hypothetical protein